jgi:hypothetical protein
MIRFPCPHCGARLQGSEVQADKKGRCPRCRESLVVPGPSSAAPAGEPARPETVRTTPTVTPYDLAFLEVPKGEAQTGAAPHDSDLIAAGSSVVHRSSAEEQAESSDKRLLPWPIDILLYPFNKAGLLTLALVIVIPLLINLAAGLLGPIGVVLLLPGTVVNTVIGAYYVWYVGQCVTDSALGGVRAPETTAQTPDLWDMIGQLYRIFACIVVAVLPVMFYRLLAQRTDVVYWSLLAFAAAIFPMTLLAVTMFDSIVGLHPALILGSALSTFLPYLGLVLVLGSAVFLLTNVPDALFESPLFGVAFGVGERYLILIGAHLLGRFYWRYQEKLNWEV